MFVAHDQKVHGALEIMCPIAHLQIFNGSQEMMSTKPQEEDYNKVFFTHLKPLGIIF